jgi:hypothetical protein
MKGGRLTAIAHNHDFGIDTVLVPGTPVQIHARIGGHGSNSRGKERTRKRSAGITGEGDKRGEEGKEEGGDGEEEKEPGRGRDGERLARRNQAEGTAGTIRRDPSRGIPVLWLRFLSLPICRLAHSSCVFVVQLIAYPVGDLFRLYNYFPIGGKIFIDKTV